MPLYIFVRFHAKDGAEEGLRLALEEIVVPTRAEPGCMGMNVFRSRQDSAAFFIHSQWKSDEDFAKDAATPHLTALLGKLPDLLDHAVAPELTDRVA